ncbi:NHL repeat-containing protein [candidate division KSB1 bacterium]
MERLLKLVLIVIVFAFTDLSAQSRTYTVEVIDGVRHVHIISPLWGDEERIKLEFVQKLGVLEGYDDNYMFHAPSDVVEDTDRMIYILEYGNKRVQKFTPDGKYVLTIGNEGDGPGEFRYPIFMDIDSENNLYVARVSAGVQKLTREGKYLKSFLLPTHFPVFRILRSGNIVFQVRENYRDPLKNCVLGICTDDGEVITEFGEKRDFPGIQDARSGNSLSIAVDPSDNIIVSFFHQNRIEKYTPDGRLIFRLDRPLNYELTVKMEDRSFTGPDGTTYSSKIPEYSWVSSGVGFDHKGRIWDLFITKQPEDRREKCVEHMEFYVYNSEGVLLTKVPIPDPDFFAIENLRIHGDHIYFMDPKHEESVYQYRIVEK